MPWSVVWQKFKKSDMLHKIGRKELSWKHLERKWKISGKSFDGGFEEIWVKSRSWSEFGSKLNYSIIPRTTSPSLHTDDNDDDNHDDDDDGDLYIIGAVCVSVSKSHYLCIQRIYFSWWEFCFSFLKYFFLIFFKFLF